MPTIKFFIAALVMFLLVGEAAWARSVINQDSIAGAIGAIDHSDEDTDQNNDNPKENSTMSTNTFDPSVEIDPTRGSYCAMWVNDDEGGALIVVGYDPDWIDADGSRDRDTDGDVCKDDEDGDVDCDDTDTDVDCERFGRTQPRSVEVTGAEIVTN